MRKKEIIVVKNVSFGYSKKEFLRDITFSVYENDFLGIVGPNGGGKTTLIKLILGLLQPTKGKITVFGQPPKKGRELIGYLSQFKDIDFDFPITAYEIVLLSRVGKKLIKKYSAEDKAIVKKCMEELKIWHLRDKKLNELSGGEKQRVFAARALATQPRVLILDEPMSNLDIHIKEDFYGILKELNKKMAILIVDHDLEMLSRYAKEVMCINKCKTHSVKYHNLDEIKDIMRVCHV